VVTVLDASRNARGAVFAVDRVLRGQCDLYLPWATNRLVVGDMLRNSLGQTSRSLAALVLVTHGSLWCGEKMVTGRRTTYTMMRIEVLTGGSQVARL